MNEESATRAILEVCHWLESVASEQRNQNPPRGDWRQRSIYEPEIANLSREYASMLMNAAMANGGNGCPFCFG